CHGPRVIRRADDHCEERQPQCCMSDDRVADARRPKAAGHVLSRNRSGQISREVLVRLSLANSLYVSLQAKGQQPPTDLDFSLVVLTSSAGGRRLCQQPPGGWSLPRPNAASFLRRWPVGRVSSATRQSTRRRFRAFPVPVASGRPGTCV